MTLSIGKMVGTLVMLRMTELPGKVWNKKSLVHDESPDIVKGLGRREGSMATFVGKNPMSSQNSSHPESISIPSSKPCESLHTENVGGNVGGEETIGGVDESSSHGSVASDEVHGVNIRFLKAFLWDCRLDFSLAWKLGSFGVERVVRTLPYSLCLLFYNNVSAATLSHD